MESNDLSVAVAQGVVRTRQSAVASAVNPYWVLVLALAGLVLVLYGFLWQPARQDPFTAPASWADWFFHPLSATEITSFEQRPLAWPATGWAPRALGEGNAAWIGESVLQLRPEGRYPTQAIWGDESGAFIGADGRIYRHDHLPVDAIRIDASPVVVSEWRDNVKISDVAFSPDGGRIVTASIDGTARVWDTATDKKVNELRGHNGAVSSVAFSPDGSRIVTASIDGTARVWDALTGRELEVLRGHEALVLSATFSPDGSRIVTASGDGTARVWDVVRGRVLNVLPIHEGLGGSAAFSPDGSRLVTASGDGIGQVWDTATARELGALSGQERMVNSAVFSPDGKLIATAMANGTVGIWDATTLRELGVLRGHNDQVFTVNFSLDGSRIVTASGDGTARIWDVATGENLVVLGDRKADVSAAEFSPDGSRIAMAWADGTVQVWSIMNGAVPLAGVALLDAEVCWTAAAAAWNCSTGAPAPPILVSLRLDAHAKAGPLAPSAIPNAPMNTGDEKRRQQQLQQQIQQQPDSNPRLAQLAMPADLPATATFQALAFRDATTLFVVGSDGLIMVAEQPTPESATFKLLRLKAGETLTGIRFDQGGAWVAGQRSRQRIGIWPFSILTVNAPVMETIVLHAQDPLAGPWQELRRFPAPWTFAAAPVVFLMLGYVGVAFARGVAVERRGIADAPSSDSPIGWRDRDALRLKPIALAMSRFIRNIDTRPPLTIAVTGGWGSGKSSLMNLLREDLRRYGARPVWFNAWHHREEVSLLAALLEAVRSAVVPHWYTWSGMVFRMRLLALRLRGPLQSALAACVLLLIALFVADMGLQGRLGSALTDIVTNDQGIQSASGAAESASTAKVASRQADGKATDADGAEAAQATAKDTPNSLEHWLEKSLSWLGLDPKTGIGAILAFAALLFVRSKLIAFPVEPAKLLSQLRNRASVTDYRDKLSFRSQFASAFGDVCRTARTSRNPGIIIIIDDLDRCPADAVLAVLEAVNYLVSAGSCFVVLGIDRKQIEHAVGLGFKDIVDGMPDRELGVAALPPADPADPAVRVTARRRAFARRYLEKLINIETAVPPLQPEAAVSMLVDEGPEPGADPRWLAPFKSTASFILDFCRTAAIAALIGGCAALLLQPFATRQIGEPPSPSTVSRLGIGTVAAPTPANDGTGQPNLAPAPAEKPFRFEPAPWHTERELIPRLAWVIGDVLLVIFLLVFLLVDLARRRMDIEKDSDAFADTLRKVTPFVHAVNPTPRAVKLFENRMRYLAARLDAEANPRRPDILDRIVRRLLPADWFDRKPPALDETKLLILGAEEISGGEIKLSRDFLSAVTADDRRAYTSIVGAASPETRS